MKTPCPNCKRAVEIPRGEKAVACPHCGAKVATAERKAEK